MSIGYHQLKHGANHEQNWINWLDRIAIGVGVIGPLATIPQVIQIWATKDATGISILSWIAYMLMDAIWIVYGIVHKQKAITISYLLWTFLELLVVVEAIIYR